MSTPRYIRLAIEASKHQKTALRRQQLNASPRTFATTTTLQAGPSPSGDRFTKGFPTPPKNRATPEHAEKIRGARGSAAARPSKRSLLNPRPTSQQVEQTSASPLTASSVSTESESETTSRVPRNVAAAYLKPLQTKAEYGVPCCDLQLRSFSVRNVEFMADFAMRAAYYLNLPASGPTPLPKKRKRWTVLRSNFVNKKSQENFEQITLRRLVQIQDGDPETVQIWLAFLRKHQLYGVGMRANIWQYEPLEVAENMDQAFSEVEKELDHKLANFGWKGTASTKSVADLLQRQGVKHVGMPLTDVREASQTREQRI